MTSKLSNKFPIPENFPEILYNFAKEVVRVQPADIFGFAIHYFKNIKSFQKGNNINNVEGDSNTNEQFTNEFANFGLKNKREKNMNNYDIFWKEKGI